MRRAAFTGLVVAAAVLGAVELTARLALALTGPPGGMASHSGFVEPDPELVWRLKPQATGPLATNSLGLRDGPYRPDADLTVLLLGDSVAWGNGILDMTKVFPSLLEEALAEQLGKSVEVINASVPGYSTFQQVAWLRRYGLALEPDLVLLQFCLNDVVERYRSLAPYGGGREFLGIDTRRAAGGVFGWLLARSNAFELAVRGVQRVARDYDEYLAVNLAVDRLSDENEGAWQVVEGELAELAGLAREAGVPLVITVAPYLFQVESPSLRQPQDRLRQLGARLGAATVDLLPAFAAAPLAAPALFSDANHFSEAGHAVAATVLARALAPRLAAIETPVPH